MGVLSDVVVADESQASAVASMMVPSQELPGADLKGIDTEKLAALEALLTARTYDEVCSEYDPVAQESGDGPWVSLIGQSLVSELAVADDDRLAKLAQAWAATEAFQFDPWRDDAVAWVLSELARLSRIAVAEEKRLLLWMSL
jgi:hypothetical protein